MEELSEKLFEQLKKINLKRSKAAFQIDSLEKSLSVQRSLIENYNEESIHIWKTMNLLKREGVISENSYKNILNELQKLENWRDPIESTEDEDSKLSNAEKLKKAILNAINTLNRFVQKKEITLYVEDTYPEIKLNNVSTYLMELRKEDKVVSIKYNNSNKLTFHGRPHFLDYDEKGNAIMLPAYKSHIDTSKTDIDWEHFELIE